MTLPRFLGLLGCAVGLPLLAAAQVNGITPDHVYMDNIHTVRLTLEGAQVGVPIISLNSGDKVRLSFDDLDGDVKNYFYTLVLCNADWQPADLNPFDYLKGFTENRITSYRFSTIPLQHYTHYSVELPNDNISPVRSGNYLVKVYLDGDTSQVAFTRRLLVVSSQVIINGVIRQPVNPKLFRSSQKVDFNINTNGLNINNPFDQVKVFILQNYRWDNAVHHIKPVFIKSNELDYNTESDCVFSGEKEWRWVDLRSFRLQTERVGHIDYGKHSTEVFVLPDHERASLQYQYRNDLNGLYYPGMLESGYDPAVDGDYATVHFTFPAETPYAGSDLYVFGELTNYECNEANKLTWNPAHHAYEGSLFLKQGYYNYMYGTIDNGSNQLNMDNTEGNWWETENNYTILVYYRPLGARADELIGVRTLNSMQNR